VTIKWTTTESVSSKSKAGETVTSHTESGTGVPHSLDDTHA
jgi:hypothetical protein